MKPKEPEAAPEEPAADTPAEPEAEAYVAPGAYRVLEAANVDTGHAFFGPFAVSFTKGKHTPKNEQEEWALEHLVALELASAPDGRVGPRPVEEG